MNQAAAALFNLPSQWLIRKPLVVFVPLQEHSTFRLLLHYLMQGVRLPEWHVHLQPRRSPPLPVALAAIVVPPAHSVLPRLLWRVRKTSF